MTSFNRKDFIVKISIIIAVIFISIWRQPELISHPRFFAEEGTCFFSYAYSHSWLNNLLTPQVGYYTLYNSLATSFAAIFPVEIAPFVTTYLAFSIQILTSCAAVWADIPSLSSNLKRFVVAISISLLPYIVIWGNTLGAQYMLCVITFLILLEKSDSRQHISIIMRGLLLFMAGLTGVVSCFMAPSFIYKAIRTKSKSFTIYSAILIMCSLTQLGVFLQTKHNNEVVLSNRFVHHDPATVLNIFLKFIQFQFFVPFFGRTVLGTPFIITIERVIRSANSFVAGINYPLAPAVLGVIICVLIAIIIFKTKDSINTQISLLSFIIVTVMSTIFSINMSGGPRYTFAPSIMLVVILVSSWQDRRVKVIHRNLAAVLIISMLIINGIESRFISFGFDSSFWPKWSDEVTIWQDNNNYSLKIWPPPWQMTLK